MQAENMVIILWQLTVACGLLKLNTFPSNSTAYLPRSLAILHHSSQYSDSFAVFYYKKLIANNQHVSEEFQKIGKYMHHLVTNERNMCSK
jgi:hypothetical protein